MTADKLVALAERVDRLMPFMPGSIMEAEVTEIATDLRALAQSAASGWRPIEEAPRDGTHVLLLTNTGLRCIAHWCDQSNIRDWLYDSYNVTHHDRPVKWQPLPEVSA